MSGDSQDVNSRTYARVDPVIGAEVSGYKIVARIGNGGMGIVYEGEHAVIGKRVAVKVLRHEVADNPDVVQRLVAEARAVIQVGHRGIIDVFGFGVLPDGRQCIVMEYLEGEPLEDVLQSHVRTNRLLPVGDVLMILDEILSALSAAHSAGVIHRDLKPSNVFLCLQRDGSKFVKLLDFGIAKLGVEAGLQSSIVIGTPTYMAPEQAAKGMVTPALDLYALGVMAFELLTGRPPFIADSPVGLLFMHAKEPPPKLTQLVSDLPPELEALIEQLLAKRPEDRPQNAAVVRLELNRIRKMLPSRPSGLLSVEIQPPRPSQPNLPVVKATEPPRTMPTPAPSAQNITGSTQMLAAGPNPLSQIEPLATPGRGLPSPRGLDAPSPATRPSQPNLPPVSASQPSLPPVRSALPSQPSLSPVNTTRVPSAAEAPLTMATDGDAPDPVPSSRKWLFAVGALAVAGVGIGVVAFSSSSSTPKSDPPVAVVPPPKITPTSPAATPDLPAAELDAGPQPSGEDASVNAPGPSPLVGDAVRGAPDASVVGTAQPRPVGAPAKKQTILATRIKKLEARLRKLEKDPSQNVGIFVTQMKRLKELLATAKSASDFDTIDVTLSRIEADLNEL